jgi:hypothetical protein
MIVEAIRRVQGGSHAVAQSTGHFLTVAGPGSYGMAMARIALGESASAFFAVSHFTQPPITTTHQRPPLSQRGAYPYFRQKSLNRIGDAPCSEPCAGYSCVRGKPARSTGHLAVMLH